MNATEIREITGKTNKEIHLLNHVTFSGPPAWVAVWQVNPSALLGQWSSALLMSGA